MSGPDHEVGDLYRNNLRPLDPRDPRCPLHLRRVCGVCPHFAGNLRTRGAVACGHTGLPVHAARNPGACRQWSRITEAET